MSEQRYGLASRILKGSVMLFFSQGATLLLYFLAQRIILSALTKEANGVLFGERRFVDLVLIMLVDFGMNGITMRRMIMHPDRAQVILSSTVAYRLMMFVPASLLSLSYAYAVGYSLVDVALWCFFLLISTRSGLIRYTYEMPFRSKVRFGWVAFLSILDAILFLGMIWWWRDQLSPTVVIQAFVISTIPGLIFMIAYDRGRTIHPRFMEMSEVRTLLRESMPVILALVFMHVHDKMDAMFLQWFADAKEVGIYGAAYVSLAPLTSTVPLAASMAIIPVLARLAKENWEECQRYAITGFRFLVVIALLSCTVLSVLTPYVIELVSKGVYADNHLHFFLFMWMPVPIFILVYVQELTIALGHQKSNIPIAGALASVTVIGGLLVIPTWHALGAVWVKLAAVVLGAAIAVVLFRRILGTGLTLQFVASIVLVLMVGIVTAVWLPTILSLPVAAAVAGIATLGASMLTGLLRTSDVRLIRTIIRTRH
jgi:O-antigen/teichoic acid export membrane protein